MGCNALQAVSFFLCMKNKKNYGVTSMDCDKNFSILLKLLSM